MVAATEEEVALGAAGMEGFRQDVQQLVTYFYADDGLLALTRETRLQWMYDTLTELFDRLVLHTNVAKTVSMS